MKLSSKPLFQFFVLLLVFSSCEKQTRVIPIFENEQGGNPGVIRDYLSEQITFDITGPLNIKPSSTVEIPTYNNFTSLDSMLDYHSYC